MLTRVRLWVRSVVLRRRLEREMQEEMASHLERATERLMGRGLSRRAARSAALREFGNVASLQEQARDARGTAWLDALAADFRYALRQYARRPATTLVMFVVLAVGMSVSALLFSFVWSYATAPPPGIEAAEDRVRIRGSRTAGADGRGFRTFGDDELRAYLRLTDHSAFEQVAGWTDAPVVLDAGEDLSRRGLEARAAFVTADYFSVLGVRPVVGPGLPASEAEAAAAGPVTVIGFAVWDQLLGRDPAVIGSVVTVNGVQATVVGVAPEPFRGVNGFTRFHVWLPLASRERVMGDVPAAFRAAARLRPGVAVSAAEAAARVAAARVHDPADPDVVALDPSTEVVPLLSASGDPMFERDVKLMTLAVGLLGVLVLLVTCTNVSGLLTGLASARRQEIAIRLSLGAGRRRVIRQLLTESALLAVIAGGAALGIVAIVMQVVRHWFYALMFEMRIEWPLTAFTFGIALTAGVLFGLSPALHATRLAVAGALRDSAGALAAGRTRLQRGLVAAQIAFTQPLIVLLAAVLLLVLADLKPRATPSSDHLVTVQLPLTAASGSEDGEQRRRAAMERVLERVRASTGVEGAVIDWRYGDDLGRYAPHPADHVGFVPSDPVALSGEQAVPGWFGVMGMELLRGRDIAPADDAARASGAADVPVVITPDLARRMWSGADPLGRRLQAEGDSARFRTLVVVGVVDDHEGARRGAGDPFRVYLPADTALPATAILARTGVPAAPLIAAIRRAVQQEAPGLVTQVRTVEGVEATHLRRFRIVTAGLSAAGLIALLLSAIGLYAVVAFSVAQRTSEIAVRLAVGARRADIAWKFVAEGLRLSAIGLAAGLPISILGLRVLMTVPDVPRVGLDQVTAIAAIGVAVVATLAAWVPARRAAAVDPAVTLRGE